jgi:hypothetical protein
MLGVGEIIEQVHAAFGANTYPGDGFLQGSFEGCEPYEEVGAFIGKTEWAKLDSSMLDEHYCALGFFSEAGFRFFLPAYLIADLQEQLRTADPLFYLCHGFATASAEVPVSSRTFHRTSGGDTLVNPRRYGAMTWRDYNRQRLSVFTREEAQAIVGYMTCKRERDSMGLDRLSIDAALEQYWMDRAANAPTREALEAHLRVESEFMAALRQKYEEQP